MEKSNVMTILRIVLAIVVCGIALPYTPPATGQDTMTHQEPAPPTLDLNRVGQKVYLKLNEPPVKIEVYAGRTKLKQFPGGNKKQFEVTDYLSKAHNNRLTFHVYTAAGKKFTKTFNVSTYQAILKRATPHIKAPPTKEAGIKDTIEPSLLKASALHKDDPYEGYTIPEDARIIVKFPRKGSILVATEEYDVKWIFKEDPDIDLSQIGFVYDIALVHGAWGGEVLLIARQRTTGDPEEIFSWRWQLPEDIISDNRYQLRFQTDDDPPKVLGYSEVFSIITYKPDLIVHDMICEEDIDEGTMTMKAVVENFSLGRANESTARLNIHGSSVNETYDLSVKSLNYGAKDTFEVTFKTFKADNYLCNFYLDIGDDVDESSEINNTGQKSCYARQRDLPDLVVGIRKEVTKYTSTNEVISAYADNIGTANSPPSRLCIGIEKRGKVCFDIPELAPDDEPYECRRVEYWTTKGWREYYAEIDPNDQIFEKDEINNKIWGCIEKKLRTSMFDASGLGEVSYSNETNALDRHCP